MPPECLSAAGGHTQRGRPHGERHSAVKSGEAPTRPIVDRPPRNARRSARRETRTLEAAGRACDSVPRREVGEFVRAGTGAGWVTADGGGVSRGWWKVLALGGGSGRTTP